LTRMLHATMEKLFARAPLTPSHRKHWRVYYVADYPFLRTYVCRHT
jgi:hypothetical protein